MEGTWRPSDHPSHSVDRPDSAKESDILPLSMLLANDKHREGERSGECIGIRT